jgi:hypothetical protein
MELKVKHCRCCGKHRFTRLEQAVDVDPFFARYGLQMVVSSSIDVPLLDWGLRRKVNRLPRGLAEKFNRRLDVMRSRNLLHSLCVKIPFGLCEDCEFLAPWYEVGYDQLRDYYAFYLQNEYKRARTEYQPGFEQLGEVMGSVAEAELRRKQHEEFRAPFLLSCHRHALDGQLHLLDYGGGEGLIIPQLPGVKGDVLEVNSSETPTFAKGELYDVVQCLHVLEHVGHPYNTYQQLMAYCRGGGLIYIEVPIEYPGLASVRAGKLPICHEHINKFCLKSIQAMITASAVDVVYLEEAEVDFLHLDGMTPVIRALARKRN